MPLFPLDNLFKQAEANPKLKDELLQAHMLEYYSEKWYRLSDCIRSAYPTLIESFEELRIHLINSEAAYVYAKEMEVSSHDWSSEDLTLALYAQRHADFVMTTIIKDIEKEIVKRGIHDH